MPLHKSKHKINFLIAFAPLMQSPIPECISAIAKLFLNILCRLVIFFDRNIEKAQY